VALLDDPQALKDIFSSVTPEFGSTKNPIDLTGQASALDYNRALEAALEQDEIHAVVSLYCETALFDSDSLARMIETNHKKYRDRRKPLIFAAFGGRATEESITTLRKRGVPVFSDVYEAISPLGAMYAHYGNLQEDIQQVERIDIDVACVDRILAVANKENRNFLLAHEGQRLMQAVDIPFPQQRIAKNLNDATRFAEELRYPVVMKVVSRDILHKSDVGGVALDLGNKNEVIDAYEAIVHNCRAQKPDAIIDGVEVSQMVPSGVEVIVGARWDQVFGPIVMFGLGGVYVEVMKDVSFRAPPLNRRQVMGMIKQTKAYPLLLGVRGEARKDIEGVVKTIFKLGALIQQCKGICDIEINPLMAYEQNRGIMAVDVRVLLSNEKRGGKHE